MKVDSINVAGSSQLTNMPKPSEEIESSRKGKQSGDAAATSADQSKVQPEELLNQIKALTEEGLYSVRFENNDEANQLVVKIVDIQTDEVIRQVPAEEVLNLSSRLEELRGNIVNTAS